MEDLLDLPLDRAELEDGRLIVMFPARSRHFRFQRRLADVVERRFPHVSGEILIRIDDRSARSPDVVAFAGPVDHDRALVGQVGKSGDATVHRYLLAPGASAYRVAETITLSELEKSAG